MWLLYRGSIDKQLPKNLLLLVSASHFTTTGLFCQKKFYICNYPNKDFTERNITRKLVNDRNIKIAFSMGFSVISFALFLMALKTFSGKNSGQLQKKFGTFG